MVNYKTHGLMLLGIFAALGSALGFAIFTVALRYGRVGDMLLSVNFHQIEGRSEDLSNIPPTKRAGNEKSKKPI